MRPTLLAPSSTRRPAHRPPASDAQGCPTQPWTLVRGFPEVCAEPRPFAERDRTRHMDLPADRFKGSTASPDTFRTVRRAIAGRCAPLGRASLNLVRLQPLISPPRTTATWPTRVGPDRGRVEAMTGSAMGTVPRRDGARGPLQGSTQLRAARAGRGPVHRDALGRPRATRSRSSCRSRPLARRRRWRAPAPRGPAARASASRRPARGEAFERVAAREGEHHLLARDAELARGAVERRQDDLLGDLLGDPPGSRQSRGAQGSATSAGAYDAPPSAR